MLDVNRKQVRDVGISFKNRFFIDVPDWVDDTAHDAVVEDALRLWLRKRAREDADTFLKKYSSQTGLKPKGLRVRDQKHHWGLCGKGKTIYINWNLIFAPKPVLEYAVVHELCHLRYRDHSDGFWGLVEAILPDYQRRKAWLDRNEHLLGLNYLPTAAVDQRHRKIPEFCYPQQQAALNKPDIHGIDIVAYRH